MVSWINMLRKCLGLCCAMLSRKWMKMRGGSIWLLSSYDSRCAMLRLRCFRSSNLRSSSSIVRYPLLAVRTEYLPSCSFPLKTLMSAGTLTAVNVTPFHTDAHFSKIHLSIVLPVPIVTIFSPPIITELSIFTSVPRKTLGPIHG